jgi:hypothetical protein
VGNAHQKPETKSHLKEVLAAPNLGIFVEKILCFDKSISI